MSNLVKHNQETSEAAGESAQDASKPYVHSQEGWIHHGMEVVAMILLIGIWLVPNDQFALIVGMTVFAAGLFLFSLMFRRLTIQESGDWLDVRMGPFSVLRRKIRFENMHSAEQGQLPFFLGILNWNWLPFRGWTHSISGNDCVVLRMASGATTRLGTDDVSGLLAAINRRLKSAQRPKQ